MEMEIEMEKVNQMLGMRLEPAAEAACLGWLAGPRIDGLVGPLID